MNPDIYKAIILGIIQGLTEFLPISSTAHLILLPWFFQWHGEINTLTFDVALHGGSLLSLLLFFYKDWINFYLKDKRFFLLIFLATIPAGLAGILFKDFVETVLRNPIIIVFNLIVFGILMLIAESFIKKKTYKPKKNITITDSLIIGSAQALALLPGVSRSAITITAGLFRNLSRHDAAKFSFLLSTPVILGAFLLEGASVVSKPDNYSLDLIFAGFLSAMLSGYLAIKFLLNFLKKYPLNIFVFYRFALAVIILTVWINQ
ncbi:MAG: undecaprenyl-diphosphate phosphatase [Thermodesulfovibrionales bacterium]|nr:undecaprenyl-diphosphate phosphatase [Thermodesulfovibrionales bacterium]